MVAFTNALLFVFNLIPIPPLDGSKVIFPFLPRAFDGFVDFMNQYGPMILLGIILISFVTKLPVLSILLAPGATPPDIFRTARRGFLSDVSL